MAALTICCSPVSRPNSRYSKRLAHDAKTGQYLGVVIGECNVYERNLNKDVKTYRVERNDGTTVDLPSDNITVTQQ